MSSVGINHWLALIDPRRVAHYNSCVGGGAVTGRGEEVKQLPLQRLPNYRAS